MSARQDVVALATAVAAQAELISQLTARVKQLEKQMERVPREADVQQLVGDTVDFLCKRPRSSGSGESDSDNDDNVAVRSAQHMSFHCVGCEAHDRAMGVEARTVRFCVAPTRRPSRSIWRP
jgi:hypothetical protein